MRTLLFVSTVLLAAEALSPATGGNGPSKLGAWRPIENLTDPRVQEIARFSVAENNKKVNGALELSRVLSGESQVVSGTKYRLIIEAASAAAGSRGPGKYKTVVWDQPWKKSRELISFQKV